MTPIPEPTADVRAQIAAMLDPRHPKKAALVVPGNEVPAVEDVIRVERSSGTLLTRDPVRAAAFADGHEHDATMAWILGYPEPKDAALAACPEAWLRVVQACDWQGNVITEALCSPGWLDRTGVALRRHGDVRLLTVPEALGRRFALRCDEAA